MMGDMDETILQFGTGKFLRCFSDLFLHEANDVGQPAGRVVALQSTGAGRADDLNRQHGRYHVAVRGLQDGQPVDHTLEVRSIGRALAAQRDWPDVLAAACVPTLRAVVSNTTEAGYALDTEDAAVDAPPRSFPAKLLRLLEARHAAGLPSVALLPCELLDGNADRLRGLVLEQARRWQLPGSSQAWIAAECSWHNTLVDRIVSAPRADDPLAVGDPLFAVAEPFALWLVEGLPAVPGLVDHPAVRSVADVTPYALRKVRILNGAHTALVAKARPLGFETVREAVADPQIGPWLRSLLLEEIVPTIEDRTEDAAQFARDVLERFANPFLDHRLADIALHHDVKLETRLAPTFREYCRQFGHGPKLLGEIVVLAPADARP